jgi:hypothetical protein
MAATLSLDTLTSSGSGITVLAGKTLTVEGVSVTAGSSNIQRATADKTIGTDTGYEVAGKSEVVVAANAASSNRTITLPAVDAVGMSTCIITVVADADATSTYVLKVQDASSSEVWTGYQKNDFVRLIVSNSLWVVLDHKETYFSSRYLASDQSIAGNSTAQLTGFTEIAEIGNMWDNTNDRVTVPTGMSGFFDINVMSAIGTTYVGTGPAYKISGVWKGLWNWGGTDGAQYHQNTGAIVGREIVTTAQYFEAWAWNKDTAADNMSGGEAGKTHFNVTFTRTY